MFNKLNQSMVLNSKKLPVAALLAVVFFSGMNLDVAAQQDQKRQITINMSATEILPADQIIFNININAEAGSPQEAFEIHKKREAVLADLLKEFDIKDEDISYQPIRINRNFRGQQDAQVVVTNQSVSVTFDDFEIYETIQVGLIENGFNNFNGRFSSSEIKEGKETALENAIKSAREKAALIAKSSGVKLGEVQNVHFSDHEVGFPKAEASTMRLSAYSDSSMMDFAQTVTVTANISISFGIQ